MGSCVVLDTNVWRKEFMLRSAMGAALLFELHRQSIDLVLPEVVEGEVLQVLAHLGREQAAAAGKHLRQLSVFMGKAPDPPLPSDEEIEAAVAGRMEELEPVLRRIPFTLDHARKALHRVGTSSSPFYRGQQYKDAAIWEAVLSAAESDDVLLVAGDKVFFEKDPTQGRLATGLDPDVENSPGRVSLFWSLANCLSVLQSDAPTINVNDVASLLRTALEETLAKNTGQHGYEPGDVFGATIRPFVTENPRVLSVVFELSVNLADTRGQGRPGRATAYGDCRYEIAENSVVDVRPERIVVEAETDAGESRRHVSVYLQSSVGGAQERVHSVRVPVAGSEYLVIESGRSIVGEIHQTLPPLT